MMPVYMTFLRMRLMVVLGMLVEQEYHQILSWADLYDHCSIAKKKMIVSQLIKAVYVRRDYEITVEFNISFDDFHTLEYHEKAAP